MRLFISTLGKLRRRPATWITFGVMAALLVLILLAVSVYIRRAGTEELAR